VGGCRHKFQCGRRRNRASLFPTEPDPPAFIDPAISAHQIAAAAAANGRV
jgi:hypothetical protein